MKLNLYPPSNAFYFGGQFSLLYGPLPSLYDNEQEGVSRAWVMVDIEGMR